MGRVNLCKVPRSLRGRLDAVKGEKNWPEFQEEVADLYESGIAVKIDRVGNDPEMRHVDIGETTTVVGDLLTVTISPGENHYECDECGEEYPLKRVLVKENRDGGIERVVCSGCIGVEDRITE